MIIFWLVFPAKLLWFGLLDNDNFWLVFPAKLGWLGWFEGEKQKVTSWKNSSKTRLTCGKQQGHSMSKNNVTTIKMHSFWGYLGPYCPTPTGIEGTMLFLLFQCVLDCQLVKRWFQWRFVTVCAVIYTSWFLQWFEKSSWIMFRRDLKSVNNMWNRNENCASLLLLSTTCFNTQYKARLHFSLWSGPQ